MKHVVEIECVAACTAHMCRLVPYAPTRGSSVHLQGVPRLTQAERPHSAPRTRDESWHMQRRGRSPPPTQRRVGTPLRERSSVRMCEGGALTVQRGAQHPSRPLPSPQPRKPNTAQAAHCSQHRQLTVHCPPASTARSHDDSSSSSGDTGAPQYLIGGRLPGQGSCIGRYCIERRSSIALFTCGHGAGQFHGGQCWALQVQATGGTIAVSADTSACASGSRWIAGIVCVVAAIPVMCDQHRLAACRDRAGVLGWRGRYCRCQHGSDRAIGRCRGAVTAGRRQQGRVAFATAGRGVAAGWHAQSDSGGSQRVAVAMGSRSRGCRRRSGRCIDSWRCARHASIGSECRCRWTVGSRVTVI